MTAVFADVTQDNVASCKGTSAACNLTSLQVEDTKDGSCKRTEVIAQSCDRRITDIIQKSQIYMEGGGGATVGVDSVNSQVVFF